MSSIRNIFPTSSSASKRELENLKNTLYVSFPAIVNTVNYSNGTVNVQPAIRERIENPNSSLSYINYPIIPNVPVVFPSTNSCSITMPINPGDNCLVVISDQSFDLWWLNGGIQNPIEQRRHDLTDAFAIFGIRPSFNPLPIGPNLKIIGPSNNSIEISNTGIKIIGNVTVDGTISANNIE